MVIQQLEDISLPIHIHRGAGEMVGEVVDGSGGGRLNNGAFRRVIGVQDMRTEIIYLS
jgi:hypothetical protein